MKKLLYGTVLFLVIMLSGCSAYKKQPYDYSQFIASNPKSILVTLPTNSSPDAKAATSVLAQATIPLAEEGYYVYPVALVNEVFQQNGITDGNDIKNVNLKKISDIFGADSILYLDVSEYGSSYQVFDSVTKVSVSATLVDVKTGQKIWDGKATAVESSSESTGNVFAKLIVSAISQIKNNLVDKGYDVAKLANIRLFAGYDGLLYGPYHPQYRKDPQLNKK